MRTNYFSQLHPGVCCCFFLYAVTFSILFNHPIMMATSCLAALFCAGSMSGWKTLGISVLFTIPTIVIFAVVNPFFKHKADSSPFSLLSVLSADGKIFPKLFPYFKTYPKYCEYTGRTDCSADEYFSDSWNRRKFYL